MRRIDISHWERKMTQWWTQRKAAAMRRTVLIADDNAFVRTALYEFFKREPDFHVCAMAENGRDAIEQASRLHPDLIVLDQTMPVMGGLEAARVLKNVMPRVLLIMYCATVEDCSEALTKSVGVSAVVSKSENASVLIDTCRSLLDRKAAWLFHLSIKRGKFVRHYPSEQLRFELNQLLRKQREVLESRMLGTASDDDLLEYEVRQEIIHDLCNVLAHSTAA
jgi:DNA-binding NarL/FixJ family response regulator